MYLFCIELCDSFFVYLHCLFVDFHHAKNTDLIVGSLKYSYIFLSGCIQPEQSSLIRYRSLRGLHPEQNKSERWSTVKETLVKTLAWNCKRDGNPHCQWNLHLSNTKDATYCLVQVHEITENVLLSYLIKESRFLYSSMHNPGMLCIVKLKFEVFHALNLCLGECKQEQNNGEDTTGHIFTLKARHLRNTIPHF